MENPEKQTKPHSPAPTLDYSAPTRRAHFLAPATAILAFSDLLQLLATITFAIDVFDSGWAYNAACAVILAAPSWIAGALAFAYIVSRGQPGREILLLISGTLSLMAFCAVLVRYAS